MKALTIVGIVLSQPILAACSPRYGAPENGVEFLYTLNAPEVVRLGMTAELQLLLQNPAPRTLVI